MAKDFKIEAAEILRDSTHNLVITEENELDNKDYLDRAKYFIRLHEGTRYEAYLDGIKDPANNNKFISASKFYSLSKERQEELRKTCVDSKGNLKEPITTVGTGINIESQEVRNKLSDLLGMPGFMDEVYSGRADITPEQDELLLTHAIKERSVELRKIYGSDWQALRANEKIVILSLHFNSPKLVGNYTKFRMHIGNYVKTSNPIHLIAAVKEVVVGSNPDKVSGVQNRRNSEGTALASHLSPTYTKPNQSPDAVKVKIAKINETRIPLSNDSVKIPVHYIKGNYFIWRTTMDQKVREDHLRYEGKVFRKDTPPVGYMPGDKRINCRCKAEEVPNHIVVNDEATKAIAFEIYLRKGIIHPILLID